MGNRWLPGLLLLLQSVLKPKMLPVSQELLVHFYYTSYELVEGIFLFTIFLPPNWSNPNPGFGSDYGGHVN